MHELQVHTLTHLCSYLITNILVPLHLVIECDLAIATNAVVGTLLCDLGTVALGWWKADNV